jgi:CheY-like chemotaxis protein
MQSGRGDGDGRGGAVIRVGALGSGADPRRPLAVLLADADPQRARLVAEWLAPFCLVAVARSIQEAAAIIGQRTPDLLITDLELPGMPGVEFIQRLAQSPITRHILLMVLTHRRTVRDKLDALRAGADEYLIWPCSEELLVQRVKLLSRFRRTF